MGQITVTTKTNKVLFFGARVTLEKRKQILDARKTLLKYNPIHNKPTKTKTNFIHNEITRKRKNFYNS